MPQYAVDEGVTESPARRNRDRAQALRALTLGESVVYAIRVGDGTIKIGCSASLARRRRCVSSSAEILGFVPGGLDEEQAVHASLAAHRARGREYYHPHPAVLAVVNEMRDRFNLPHLAS
jgi:hypothetical protein